MDRQQILTAFLSFAGKETFRKFVLQFRRDSPANSDFWRNRQQLRFWQAELWSRFKKVHSDVPDDIESLRSALLWCDLHQCYLASGRGIVEEEFGDQSALSDAIVRLFPFGYGYHQLICIDCVTACREWIAAHRL